MDVRSHSVVYPWMKEDKCEDNLVFLTAGLSDSV